MGGSSEKTTTENKSTSTYFPDWTQSAGQDVFTNAANWLSQNPTMPMYNGDRVADFGSGFGQATDYASGKLGATDPLTTQAGNAFSGVVNSIDPNATIQSLMNPYVDATLAPTLRNINESADRTQAGEAASATAAGALGDTGYGLEQAMNNRNRTTAIGDATSSAYSKAYDAANSIKNSQLSQLMQGATGLNSTQAQDAGQKQSLAQMLASLGATQQQAGQKGIDSSIADFNTATNYPIKQSMGLSSILNTIPKNSSGMSSGTSTSSEPDNTAAALAGTALQFLLF